MISIMTFLPTHKLILFLVMLRLKLYKALIIVEQTFATYNKITNQAHTQLVKYVHKMDNKK